MAAQIVTGLLTFSVSEEGATSLEYGLLVSLIVVAMIGAVSSVAQIINNAFSNVSSVINAAS